MARLRIPLSLTHRLQDAAAASKGSVGQNIRILIAGNWRAQPGVGGVTVAADALLDSDTVQERRSAAARGPEGTGPHVQPGHEDMFHSEERFTASSRQTFPTVTAGFTIYNGRQSRGPEICQTTKDKHVYLFIANPPLADCLTLTL